MEKILELLITEENTTKQTNLIEEQFKLPIETIDEKIFVENNIHEDLELLEFKNQPDLSDLSGNTYKENLYNSIFEPKNQIEQCITNKWSNYYTNNKNFLNETQDLLKNYKNTVSFENDTELCENCYNSCEDITKDNGFMERYQYIDLPYLKKYNNDEICMQMLSIFNLANPVLSLVAPILLLLLPFFIIKLQGHNITLDSYFEHLKQVFSSHILGQFFTGFYDAPLSTKVYLLISIIFYVFQMYQNIISCGNFYKNINYIHEKIFSIRDYISNSINNFNNLLKHTSNLITYEKFNEHLNNNLVILNNYLSMLNKINVYKISVKKIFELGHLMRCFYKLYNDQSIINSLYFSFGCNGYIQNISTLQKHIKNNSINLCNYVGNNEITTFKNSYYGELLSDPKNKIVKNSYKLSNNLILTGPNAAGKTTLLKSSIFNILLCQQLGGGFFEQADVKIYDFIHCYINIPDTSSRDSLFQAEARRCKDILTIIENNNDKNHFCVFDELYSGTNPDDAISSGTAFLNHINKKNNVNYILTTHYYKLCKKLDRDVAKNYHMEINKDKTGEFEFTYKIKKGISKIKGGLKVLKDLDYPKEIIQNLKITA